MNGYYYELIGLVKNFGKTAYRLKNVQNGLPATIKEEVLFDYRRADAIFITNAICHKGKFERSPGFLKTVDALANKICEDHVLYYRLFTQSNSDKIFLKFYNYRKVDITEIVYWALAHSNCMQIQYEIEKTDAGRVAIYKPVDSPNVLDLEIATTRLLQGQFWGNIFNYANELAPGKFSTFLQIAVQCID